ncbi:golgin subfamily A member 7-like isoform X1 [Amphibalanus amphitrite]|uniref:golgin subfamily A member 7-like isoform X1 n=1 Tax=Amphibalanus amphitrite TaxID=1232801 RepID=UPI001C919B47|nr:golgin subfamily A member 7-like isoform X1 [Amphibalanus amphitrite]
MAQLFLSHIRESKAAVFCCTKMASKSSKPAGGAEQTEHLSNCLKVFIQRDYSEGTAVRFQSTMPPELEGRIEPAMFDNTLATINEIFMEAEELNCATYCEGCLACLTAYCIYTCMDPHYDKCVKKCSRYIVEQNERYWLPRGLLITDPIERGLRVIEVSVLNEPAPQR